MNGTPRVLNRILIGIFGLLLLLSGVLVAFVAWVPSVAAWWQEHGPALAGRATDLFQSARIPGQAISWLWVAATLALVLLVILMVAWTAQQGKGRTDVLASSSEEGDVPGRVSLGSGVAEQALRQALGARKDVLSAAVTAVAFRGRTVLRLRLVARQGADPRELSLATSALLAELEETLGVDVPLLLHITSGARTRLSRVERVR